MHNFNLYEDLCILPMAIVDYVKDPLLSQTNYKNSIKKSCENYSENSENNDKKIEKYVEYDLQINPLYSNDLKTRYNNFGTVFIKQDIKNYFFNHF